VYTSSKERSWQQEEQDLLLLLKAGDQQAFEKLYQVYSVRLLQRLLRLLKDRNLAKELLQDVFLKVWERRGTIDPLHSIKPYLYRIAENLVMDYFRRAATDRKVMDHLIQVSTELYDQIQDELDTNTLNQTLKEAIDQLPEQRKAIFIQCKLEGRSYEEVAKEMGISRGTVNDHMVKSMRFLRKYFTNHGAKLMLLVAFVSKNL